MFNLGFTHLLILGVIALVVIGPEQLPEMARKFAKLLNELRRAKDEILAPMSEFQAEAQRMIDDTKQKATQDIAKLVEMRDKLDAEIRTQGAAVRAANVSPAPPPPAPAPTVAPVEPEQPPETPPEPKDRNGK